MGRGGSLGDTDCARRCGAEEGNDDDTEDGEENALCVGRNLVGNESEDEIKEKAKGTASCSGEDTGSERSRIIGLTSVDSGCCNQALVLGIQ